MIKIRRVFEPEGQDEGYRILVDRLWPRGISKEKAGWDEWMKDVAPSNQLRIWYNHDSAKWTEFKRLYKNELVQKQNELQKIKQLEAKHGLLTLLYSSREKELNNAVALKEFLSEQGNDH